MSGRMGELLLVLLIIFIVFGAGKLPKVMSELGKGLKSFKEGANKLDEDEQDKKVKDELK